MQWMVRGVVAVGGLLILGYLAFDIAVNGRMSGSFTVLLMIGILVVPALMRVRTELALFDGHGRLAALRQVAGSVEVEGTEMEVRNRTGKALIFWFPVLLLDGLVVLVIIGQARIGAWAGMISSTVLLGVLMYATVRRLQPGPILILNERGITFVRLGVHLTWRQVQAVRLKPVVRPHLILGGSETVLCFAPHDVERVRREMRPLPRLLTSVARNWYGTPLAIFDAPLDSAAEEIAAMAERYSGRDDMAHDIR
ncbi:hypothetical protein [Streptosporangium sp. KLBMP 9127]|nr:hypothetical protein [Streptosporangium sp. KLBMP 9127]